MDTIAISYYLLPLHFINYYMFINNHHGVIAVALR